MANETLAAMLLSSSGVLPEDIDIWELDGKVIFELTDPKSGEKIAGLAHAFLVAGPFGRKPNGDGIHYLHTVEIPQEAGKLELGDILVAAGKKMEAWVKAHVQECSLIATGRCKCEVE